MIKGKGYVAKQRRRMRNAERRHAEKKKSLKATRLAKQGKKK